MKEYLKGLQSINKKQFALVLYLWIVANANSNRLEGRNYIETKRQWQAQVRSMAGLCETKIRNDIPAPDAFGVANGLPSRMDRLKAIGNGQVPLVAATAFRILSV